MSLFLEERIAEQNDDDLDNITFTFPWIISIANEDSFTTIFQTRYKFCNVEWGMVLGKERLMINDCFGKDNQFLNGICSISYILYQDNDMLIELYSSPKITIDQEMFRKTIFIFSSESIKEFNEAVKEKSAAKAVFFIELVLPSKPFYYPYEGTLNKTYCKEYPNDMENNDNFSFLNKGDFTIDCTDGKFYCSRSTLYATSEGMNKVLTDLMDKRISIYSFNQWSIDVIKPIIIFLHTLCFEMPNGYDLNYAKQLVHAINFFQPYQRNEYNLKAAVELELCKKFFTEKHTFDTILLWTSIACQHSLPELYKMLVTVVADKFYYKWNEAFPSNNRSADLPLYESVFGTTDDAPHGIFKEIENIVRESLCTNVIFY